MNLRTRKIKGNRFPSKYTPLLPHFQVIWVENISIIALCSLTHENHHRSHTFKGFKEHLGVFRRRTNDLNFQSPEVLKLKDSTRVYVFVTGLV